MMDAKAILADCTVVEGAVNDEYWTIDERHAARTLAAWVREQCVKPEKCSAAGVELIAAERQRQIESEGWTAEHDDKHDDCELLSAAMNYERIAEFIARYGRTDGERYFHGHPPLQWPWEKSWWKPDYENAIPNLVKAGALIAAEIDRLQRSATHAR